MAIKTSAKGTHGGRRSTGIECLERLFSALHHGMKQYENGTSADSGPGPTRMKSADGNFQEGLCLSVAAAVSSSNNASVTVFACCANRTTRFVFVRMVTIIARTVVKPVTFARKLDPLAPASRQSGS